MSGVYRKDFFMFNKDVGVATDPNSGYFTSNAFGEFTRFGNFSADGEYVIDSYITHIDATSAIITNCCGAHILTTDNGKTAKSANASKQLFATNFLRIKAYGKGSDNYFYELGFDLNGGAPYKQYVIKSINGFDNWELVAYNTKIDLGRDPYFYDADLLFTKSYTNEFSSSSNLGLTWTVHKGNIQSFFIKNRVSWYVVSDNKLYFTSDSGQNWNLEMELPVDSKVNYMSFSPNKTVLAGKNLLYINHL